LLGQFQMRAVGKVEASYGAVGEISGYKEVETLLGVALCKSAQAERRMLLTHSPQQTSLDIGASRNLFVVNAPEQVPDGSVVAPR